MDFAELTTPALLIDAPRLDANISRMNRKLEQLGVPLRPHLKTVKNAELARRMLSGMQAATVSTLAEADYFFDHGLTDLLYAVGIAPGKLGAVVQRMRDGMQLTLILDHPDAAEALTEGVRQHGVEFRVLLEIDADGHRAGFKPDDPALIRTADLLVEGGARVAGVMVHAGGSYACRDQACLIRMAEQERRAAVSAAGALRAAGHDAPIVSVGSTPTALFAESMAGVTEVRAGVYAFMDLVMAGLGVCRIDDIALTVLTEVIGHREQDGQVLVDAGWMALSRDRGTADQAIDQGYGVVCDASGKTLTPDVIVASTNQEHGIVARRDGQPLRLEDFPIGRRLRVLPNHACATAGQFETFTLIEQQTEQGRILERCRGW